MEYGVTLTVTSALATKQLGEFCGRVVQPGTVIGLRGRLGAGKTTFVAGLARGLGLDEITHSPTFALVSEYEGGRLPLYHMDLYRLGENATSEIALFDEYLYGEGVCAIEWADLLQAYLPEAHLDLHFLEPVAHGESFDTRQVVISAKGIASVNVLKEWMTLWPY